jgi:hypothetical protein
MEMRVEMVNPIAANGQNELSPGMDMGFLNVSFRAHFVA